MAILSKEINQVQVRIRRQPQDTYFDEYVKVGDRQKPDATSCDRYIIPEPGQMYTIEVTLKRGYNFGNSKAVNYHNFTENDITVYLTFTDRVNIGGTSISGARLSFHELEIDEDMQNETNVMGVDPTDLRSLRVEVMKMKYDLVPMTHGELAKELEKDRKWLLNRSRDKRLWDVKKVDQENFKKHGITAAIGFVGGHQSQVSSGRYWVSNMTHGEPLNFQFHCRPAVFLEHVNIVRYPPPLHRFPWEQLDQDEQRLALQQLQEMDKKRVTQCGTIEIDFEDEPEEWDSWNTMQPPERCNAFKKLQQNEKAYRRVQVQNQIAEIPGNRVQDLERDASGIVTRAGSHRSRRATIDLTDSPQGKCNARKRPARSQLHRYSGTTIKQEISKTKTPTTRDPIIKEEQPSESILIEDRDSEHDMSSAKHLKIENISGDGIVDLSRVPEFNAEEYQAATGVEMLHGNTATELGQNIEPERSLVESHECTDEPEDVRSEEEKLVEAEKKVRGEAEWERLRLETEKQMAAYMEQLRSQM